MKILPKLSNNGNAFLLNNLFSWLLLEYHFINNIKILNKAKDQSAIDIDLKTPINIYSMLIGICSDKSIVKDKHTNKTL